MTTSVTSQSPVKEAVDVSPGTPISFTITTTLTVIMATTVTVDGHVAFDSGVFSQDYPGRLIEIGPSKTLIFNPRRAFPYGSVVQINISGTESPDFEVQTPFTLSFRFFTSQDPKLSGGQILRQTKVDRTLTTYGAGEACRVLLKAALCPPGGAFLGSLLYRVQSSQLRTLLDVFDSTGALRSALAELPLSSLGSVITADTELRRIELLWGPVLNELALAGVRVEQIKQIEAAMRRPYPQERVAAASAAVLFLSMSGAS